MITFKKMSKYGDSSSNIERMVNVLGEGPSKITITNASVDKQKALKRDYIIYYLLARRCSRHTSSYQPLCINLLKYKDPKDIT